MCCGPWPAARGECWSWLACTYHHPFGVSIWFPIHKATALGAGWLPKLDRDHSETAMSGKRHVNVNDGTQRKIESDGAGRNTASSSQPGSNTDLERETLRDMTFLERQVQDLTLMRGLSWSEDNLLTVELENWNRQSKLAEERYYKALEEVRGVKNEIYQVIGFFSAFQGLLLTSAVTEPIVVGCKNGAYLIALSGFAMAIAVVGILQKKSIIQDMKSYING